MNRPVCRSASSLPYWPANSITGRIAGADKKLRVFLCKDSAPVFAGAASFYPLTEDMTAVQPAGASGAAGEQQYKIPVLPDQNSVYIIGVDDLYAHDPVSQSLPKICYVNLVPVLKQFFIRKVLVSVPAPVPGNHAAAVFTADRDTGLREDTGTFLTCVFTQTKGTKALPDFHVHLIAVHGGRCGERLALQMLTGHIFIQSGIET